MMKYDQLSSRHQTAKHRVGRGIAAGRGKTAGRGTKGQGARKSGGVRPGFEGGQTPLQARIPKLRGFRSRRPKFENVHVGQLESIKKLVVDSSALAEAGLISSPFARVKLLVGGELKTKKDVRLPSASAGAADAVKKAGGSFTSTDRLKRPATRA